MSDDQAIAASSETPEPSTVPEDKPLPVPADKPLPVPADKYMRDDVPAEDDFGAFMATGWESSADGLPDRDEVASFTAHRRSLLAARFAGDVLVVPTGNLKVRANDTDYVFRPSSDFYWLTGFFEPDSVLIMDCTGAAPKSTLFVAGRADRTTPAFYRDGRYGELWVGPREGVPELEARLGISTRALTELPDVLHAVTPAIARVLRDFDASVEEHFTRNETSDVRDAELALALSELRLIKDRYEVDRLREAMVATAVGFEECVREIAHARTLPSGERWLEGTFWRRSRVDGNDVGYGSIIGCGHHATTLHWTRNDGPVRNGDMALLDMGVESRSLYTADVTRTVPINGRFSEIQRRVYDAVWEAQTAALQEVKPGAAFLAPHRKAMEILAQRLQEWGILTISAKESIDSKNHHRRYTLHGVSHMLGLDVHDCTNARNEYWDGELREGMVLTVEPGLYFQMNDATVPVEYRGIGVRIEDDVLVTADGFEVLSNQLPTEAAEVEQWMAGLID